MKRTRLAPLAAGIFLFAASASAQLTRGYVFVAPGGTSQGGATARTYSLGGGVERLLERGVAASAEIQGTVPGEGRARNSFGIASFDGGYHLLRESRLDPFASAGYSLIFRDYTANAFNFGGGLNYWFDPGMALRVEFRDHLRGANTAPSVHYWGIRIGLAFR